jgi:hypothetical protein
MVDILDVTDGTVAEDMANSKTNFETLKTAFEALAVQVVTDLGLPTLDSGKYLTNDGDLLSWDSVQAPLVSGTNIKTINGSSILASGDLTLLTASTDVTIQLDSYVTLTSGTEWTCPAGVRKVRMLATGAGGGSEGNASYFGPSGGGGGTVMAVFAVTPATVYTYAIGAGSAKADGGDTTFTANDITYTGSGGKKGGSYGGAAGDGGSGSGTGAVVLKGDAGKNNIETNSPVAEYGGNTATGYGIGASSVVATSGQAGAAGGIILELYK